MSRRAGCYIWSKAGSTTLRLNTNYFSHRPDVQEENCLARFAKTRTGVGGKGRQVVELVVYLRDGSQSACSIMEDGG